MSAATTMYEFQAKCNGQTQSLAVSPTATVADLTKMILDTFNLSTAKLIGLTKARLPSPDTPLSTLALPSSHPVKLMVIGQTRQSIDAIASISAKFEAEQREQERREAEERERREYERLVYETEEAERRRVADQQRIIYEQQQRQRAVDFAAARAREEAERRARELAEEQQTNVSVDFTLTCLVSPEADAQDKLILPPNALQTLIEHKQSFSPLCFKITPTVTRRSNDEHVMTDVDDVKQSDDNSVYYGVHDFSAPLATICLVPRKLLTQLHIDEGASIHMTTITLPTATHITLKPLTPSFMLLTELERTALLELNLRKRQMMHVGETIRIDYHQPYDLQVVDCQPSHVVSLVDSEVQTDIQAPDADSDQNRSVLTSASTPQATLSNEPITSSVKENEYSYYILDIVDINLTYTITLSSQQGDADLYVSYHTQKPTLLHCDKLSQTIALDTVTVSSDDAAFKQGPLYVGIRGYQADATYTLSVTTQSTTLNSQRYSMANTDTLQADTTHCPNCQRSIAHRAFTMHTLQCARQNYRCVQCATVMPVRERAKHDALVHTALTCTCGVKLEQSAMLYHTQYDCPRRLLSCVYCPLSFEQHQRGAHQAECGLLHSICKLCGENFQRKLIRRHMATQHGLDERSITWREFW